MQFQMFNLRGIDSLSSTTRGKYLQAFFEIDPKDPTPGEIHLCRDQFFTSNVREEDLVTNINNVGCGTSENRKER